VRPLRLEFFTCYLLRFNTAHSSSEDEAIELVKLMVDATKIEVEGIRDDGMKAAFGDMPEGSAVFRNDWTWSLDGEKPVPQ
jgi:hypothetical protein